MSEIYATIVDGVAHAVAPTAAFQSTTPEGLRLTHLAGSLAAYTEQDLILFGIHRLALPAAPEGEVETARNVTVQDGVPVLDVTFGPAPPAPIPLAVDMRQARLKLLSEPHGEGTRLDAVEAYVATQGRSVQIEWLHARELRRDHPLVGIMGVFFEQTSADLDQWFREAAAIGPTLAL
ncbi:MAG: hypothetical protein Q8L59_11065 [Phenylobacterium sp.]|nr:hypothetical protein [Phenylobacterium sp.]